MRLMGGNSKRPRTHGRSPYSRLGNISRNIARIIRHGQRPSGDPPIPLTLRLEAYVRDLVDRPLFKQFETADADIVQLANDVDGDQKRMINVIFEGSTHSYMVGVYKGGSVPVERAVQDNFLISQPGFSAMRLNGKAPHKSRDTGSTP